MSTDVTHREVLDLEHDESDEEEVNAYLRAHGVQPRTRRWEPSWEPVKPRPTWLAFVFRMLRKLGYED